MQGMTPVGMVTDFDWGRDFKDWSLPASCKNTVSTPARLALFGFCMLGWRRRIMFGLFVYYFVDKMNRN